MPALPYLLDGLADQEIAEHNARCAHADRVVDPIPSAIMSINDWLHWYHLLRHPEPDEEDIDRLTDGLCCNMRAWAQSPGATTISLVKGLSRVI
jgi:hypothetical protein